MTKTDVRSAWPTRPLIEFLDPIRTVRYGIVQPGKYEHAGVIMLRSQDYSKGWVSADIAYRVSPAIAATYRNAALRAGDLIMTIVGAGIGQVETAPDWLDGAVLSRSTARIAVNDELADPRFVRACLESRSVQEQMWNCVKEGAQPVVSCGDVVRFTLPCPSLPEQRAIAAALSDVDELIGALDKLIAKKRAIKLATMQQLLTGKTRLPGFSGGWKSTRLGDHVAFLRKGAIPRAQLDVDGPIKYLHYGDVHGSSQVHISPLGLPSVPAMLVRTLDRLRDGDLVFVDASEDREGVGKSVEIEHVGATELVSGLHTIAARFDKQVLADGFKGYLQFCPPFYRHLKSLAAGTKVYATTQGHVASVEMHLPNPDEQTAIATVLSDMDAEITTLEQRRDKTKAIKQAMMQSLLTGRVRLVEPETTV